MDRSVRSVESAAVAGLVYAVLSVVTLWLFDQRPVSPQAAQWDPWIADSGNRTRLTVGLGLASVAGVAFLWFVAVVRRRIGDREDRFFATVFLGSALVLVSLWLVTAAIIASPALVRAEGEQLSVEAFRLVEGIGSALLLVAAPRIQAVFVASTSTLLVHTSAVPRWVAHVGYAIAGVMFVWPFVTTPIGFGLPVFVAVVSVVILLGVGSRASEPDGSVPGSDAS